MDFFTSYSARGRPEKRSPRVVQIPVHFVGSESARPKPDSETESALKIQRVFRGFLVRRSVRRIMSIKREVDAVEARISQSEVADLIRKDAKERLKVNETLMALLFKLDAISSGGVDSGVRVCRRAVIKKAIALQERVDSIANSDYVGSNGSQEEKRLIETGSNEEDESMSNNGSDGSIERWSKEDGSMSNNRGGDCCEEFECVEQNEVENGEGGESGVNNDGLKAVDSSTLIEEVNEEERCEIEHSKEIDDDDDKKKDKELMERMIEENGNMKKMMSDLCERNEAQSRMLNTLTRRLELLEKAFVCDKLRRKKKRHCSS